MRHVSPVILGMLCLLGWSALAVISLLQIFDVITLTDATGAAVHLALMPLAVGMPFSLWPMVDALADWRPGVMVGAVLLVLLCIAPDLIRDRVGQQVEKVTNGFLHP